MTARTNVTCLTFAAIKHPARQDPCGPRRASRRVKRLRYPRRFGQRLKRRGIENDDSAVFEANPAAPSPNPQLLVDAFPGHADHLADFLLRNGNRPPARHVLVLLGQTNQRAGEPARQILQDHLLNLVAGPPQPHAQQLDEFHRQFRLIAHEGKKLAAIDRENFATGIRRCVGRSCLPIENRHLAEDLTGAD